jgi:hypothetical protein
LSFFLTIEIRGNTRPATLRESLNAFEEISTFPKTIMAITNRTKKNSSIIISSYLIKRIDELEVGLEPTAL